MAVTYDDSIGGPNRGAYAIIINPPVSESMLESDMGCCRLNQESPDTRDPPQTGADRRSYADTFTCPHARAFRFPDDGAHPGAYPSPDHGHTNGE